MVSAVFWDVQIQVLPASKPLLTDATLTVVLKITVPESPNM